MGQRSLPETGEPCRGGRLRVSRLAGMVPASQGLPRRKAEVTCPEVTFTLPPYRQTEKEWCVRLCVVCVTFTFTFSHLADAFVQSDVQG